MRNQSVGMKIGRLVYYLARNARADSDLPLLIYLSSKGGTDMGDIGHSHNLVARLLSFLSTVVEDRIKDFLGRRMVATGCLPPVNIMADKATDKRDSRQLVGLLTYNPGGAQLFEAIYLGCPKCPGGSGDILTNSILKVIGEYVADNSQVKGLTGDGVYKHCKVNAKLEENLEIETNFTHDLMHLAALIDTAMRNKKSSSGKFNWLNKLTLTICSSIRFIQWGKEWAHFFKVYTEMVETGQESRVLRPKNFSETKMANHMKQVYDRFRDMTPALIVTLEEAKEESYEGDKEQREKARNAESVMGKVYNATFLLSVSSLIDIYTVYSGISTNFQIVNMMPFDRMDRFFKFLGKFDELLAHRNPPDCPCSIFFDYDACELLDDDDGVKIKELIKEVCVWKTFHADLREMKLKGTYRNLLVGCMEEDTNKTREGVRSLGRNLLLDLEGVAKTVGERADDVTNYLVDGLRARVYTNEEVELINNVRELLDFRAIISQIESSGAATVSAEAGQGEPESWCAAGRSREGPGCVSSASPHLQPCPGGAHHAREAPTHP